MTFRCANFGGNTWTSRLRPNNGTERSDGEIEVEPEDNNTGKFSGTHLDSWSFITGKCIKGGGAADTCTITTPCGIQFKRRTKEREGQADVPYTYTYEGRFFRTEVDGRDVFRTIDELSTYMKRRRGREAIARGERLEQGEEDGIWIGEKPAT